MIGDKLLRIRFNKIDGFIRVYDGTRYVVLLGAEKYDFIYSKIRYLTGIKHAITYIFTHDYTRIKVDSYDSLHLKETWTFHNTITHIKSV